MKTILQTGQRLVSVVMVGFAVAIALPEVRAQTPVPPKQIQFTNSATGVSSFSPTNTLIQITNGTLTVTSAPVALFRDRGFALSARFSPTNALLTNFVARFRFSPDGTNWANEPVLTWRTGGSAIAAGAYQVLTNVPPSLADNWKYIQLYQIDVTNGVNTVGSVFLTNTVMPFTVQVFP